MATSTGNWALRAAAALRAARQAPHGVIARAALTALQATAESLGRVLHVLFLEVTGFVFACFALLGGGATWREYQRYTAGQIGPQRAIVAGVFALVFAWFALSNFWRSARKRS